MQADCLFPIFALVVVQVSIRSLMHALLTICKQAPGLSSLGADLGILLILDVTHCAGAIRIGYACFCSGV